MGRSGPPLVTGVAPKEGPPGTRITIRGENLGYDPKDLIGVKICGVDCLLAADWKSPSKIIARSGPGKGKGDIIVITKSGGQGTCTVGFKGYYVQIGPLQESAIWIDESQSVSSNLRHGRPSSPLFSKDDEDPLGISDEGNQAKFSEEDLLELFPEASGNMSIENFSSSWYLLENHHSTSFDDLRAGLAHMKRKAKHRSEGPIAFVKTNLSSTLDCLDSLQNMYSKFCTDDIRGEFINSYAVLLMQAKSCADGLFQEVLGRKDKADSTRNALSVLQRFKFLFYLPLNLQRNIQKGDYNMVINDYIRARSLFADTQVQVFRKVYKEVENQINEFRDMLKQKLMELPNSLENQKKLIKYLISLECSGDPAWECLVNQQKWLTTILLRCKEQHLQEEKESQPNGDVFGTPQRTSNLSRAKPGDSNSLKLEHGSSKFTNPQRIMYIEELCEILTYNLPDLWKLGQAYFSGALIVKEQTGEKAFKIDVSKHSQFKQMITDTISLFSNLVRAAFLPQTLPEKLSAEDKTKYGQWNQVIPGDWLPSCVRHIRNCVWSLSLLDLPGESPTVINDLAFDMRTNCMFTLLKQAIADIQQLHIKETWIVETDDESGGTTQLPALFENIVNETIQHLHEVVVQNKQGEPEIFGQRTVQKDSTQLCSELLQAFVPCLDCLAFTPVMAGGSSNTADDSKKRFSTSSMDFEEHSLQFDKRLIIMLSNCSHTMERIIPRLVENLNKHGYVEMNKALQTTRERYEELDSKLFEAYIEEKSNPIVGAIEQNMYRGRFDWKTCRKPAGVRNYLKDVIMKMIEVHAEVFAVSPSFVTRVTQKVVESVSEEITRVIECVTEFNEHGKLQARVELKALQETVKLYITPHANQCFKEAMDNLGSMKPEDKKLLEDLLNKYKSQMKFQMMCFYGDSLLRNSVSA
ncbi:exocyst complex component 2-like isoform X2 [Mytilus galloprovincialis]|uniref:exocyst complex component 2-like isoform X2 n=1 Tax=Mytilus galloprovincialis TaxID=29158 RepID=UPI003F7CC3C8